MHLIYSLRNCHTSLWFSYHTPQKISVWVVWDLVENFVLELLKRATVFRSHKGQLSQYYIILGCLSANLTFTQKENPHNSTAAHLTYGNSILDLIKFIGKSHLSNGIVVCIMDNNQIVSYFSSKRYTLSLLNFAVAFLKLILYHFKTRRLPPMPSIMIMSYFLKQFRSRTEISTVTALTEFL